MAILCEFIVIEDVFPAEEPILDALIGLSGIDMMLLLSGVMDLDFFFDELVVAELSGVCSVREGDFDTAEKGIILVALELFSQDGIVHLLAVVFLHVQILHCSLQLGISHMADPWLIGEVDRRGLWVGHFDVHAVEPKDELLIGLQGDLDGVEGGDQIQVILFEGEEEDVRTQAELELPRHDEIAVDAGCFSEFVFVEGMSEGSVAVRHISTQVILYIEHEVILEGHFQFRLYPPRQQLREGGCLASFLLIFGIIGGQVEGYIHCCHKSAGEILDVHFGHIAEVASHVGRDEGSDLLPFVQHHQRILAETICPIFLFPCLFECLAQDVLFENGVFAVTLLRFHL